MKKPHILIVEDEQIIALNLKSILERFDYHVLEIVSTREEAVTSAALNKPDLILMDISLDDSLDGIEAVKDIRKILDVPVIYITANADKATVEKARETEPSGYLNKPISERDLYTNIDTAIYKNKMEKKLRESEEKYRKLIEDINDIVYSTDEKGVIDFISPQIESLSGYSDEELIGKSLIDLFHKDDRSGVKGLYNQDSERKISQDFRLISSEGGIIWVHMSGRAETAGEFFHGIKGTMTDISDIKFKEEEIKEKNIELESKNRELLISKDEIAKNEALLGSIFRVAPTGIGIVKNRVLGWTNSMVQKISGYRDDELKGQSARMLYPTDEDYEFVGREKYRQIRDKGTGTVETRWKRRDGKVIDVLLSSTPLNTDDLEEGVVFTVLDITEQKEAQRVLKESEEQLKLVFEAAIDGIYIVDAKTKKTVMFNSTFCSMLGYEEDEMWEISVNDIHPETELAHVIEQFDKQFKKEIDIAYNLPVKRKDGSVLYADIASTPIEINGRSCMMGFFRDTTDQKKMEDELMRTRGLLFAAIEQSPAGIIIADAPDANIRLANSAAINLRGDSSMPLLNISADQHPASWQVFHPDGTAFLPEELPLSRAILDGERIMNSEAMIRTSSGEERWVLANAAPVRDNSGGIIAGVVVFNDITEKKKSEALLLQSQEKYKNLVDHANDGICIVQDEKVKYVNRRLAILLGSTEKDITGSCFSDYIAPGCSEDVLRRLARFMSGKEDVQRYETRIVRKDGREVDAEFNISKTVFGETYAALVLISDISERKKAQELMVMTEKMMTLGSLAAGMAHEINNPLGVIIQGVQTVLSMISPDFKQNRKVAEEIGIDLDMILKYLKETSIIDFLEGMRDAGLRASKIVANMLQFSRGRTSKFEMAAIHDLINSVIEIAANDYDLKKKYDFRKIKVVKKYDKSLVQVPCVISEIEQVLLNILKNSSQAMIGNMPEGKKPVITISTYKEDQWIVITIADNGPGIEEETSKHIFEPFYTTKGSGLGTGLGLAVSYFIIVNNHKGHLIAESQPGEGAVFRIKLPLDKDIDYGE